VSFFRACTCVEWLHLVLLMLVHRFGPPSTKRLFFVLLSHALFIVTYRLFAAYADGLWFERPFNVLHGATYVMLQVALGKTVQDSPWIVLATLEPVLCLWSLDLTVEGRPGLC